MATLPTSVDPSAPVPSVDLDGTLGVTLIGLVLSTLLFGASILQLYVYYNQYPKDWILYKVSVAILWLLDGLNLVLTAHAVYHYAIRNFGRYDQLDVVVWSVKAEMLVNAIVIVTVQSLYSLRLWKLNMNHKKRWYPKFVPLFIVLGTGIVVSLVVELLRLDRFSQLDLIKWVGYASFATAIIVDSYISIALVCYLRDSRTIYDKTNDTLTTLVIWVMSTGATTSLCAFVALITYAFLPQKLVFLAVQYLLSGLYVNSFLAFLNARNNIRERSSAMVTIDGLRCPPSPVITPATASKSDTSHPAGYIGRRSSQTFIMDASTHVEP